MFELLRSPKTSGLIAASPASLLFFPKPNLSISSRQSCDVSLRNAASWGVVWNGLTLPFTLKLPQAAPR